MKLPTISATRTIYPLTESSTVDRNSLSVASLKVEGRRPSGALPPFVALFDYLGAQPLIAAPPLFEPIAVILPN